MLTAAVLTFFFVGRVFMPTLDETNFNLSSLRIPSTSIEQSVKLDLPLERAMLVLPEVSPTFSKQGQRAWRPIRCRRTLPTIT